MRRLNLFTKYFAVVEPTRKFWPHIHALLDARFIRKPEFAKLCSAWDARVNYIYKSIRSSAGYLIMYLGKDFRAAHHSELKRNSFHAYLRAMKIRQWSCSRGLIVPYKSRTDRTYDYAGTYENYVRELKKRKNLIYEHDDITSWDAVQSYGTTKAHLVIDHDTWVDNDWEESTYDCPVAEQHINSNAD